MVFYRPSKTYILLRRFIIFQYACIFRFVVQKSDLLYIDRSCNKTDQSGPCGYTDRKIPRSSSSSLLHHVVLIVLVDCWISTRFWMRQFVVCRPRQCGVGQRSTDVETSWLYFPRRYTFVTRLRPITGRSAPFRTRFCHIASANVLHAPTCFIVHSSRRSLSYRNVDLLRSPWLNVLSKHHFLVSLRCYVAQCVWIVS